MYYAQYSIKETDRFAAADYPRIVEDMDAILLLMAQMPTAQNSQMVVSFAKNHCLLSEWVATHPLLAELISSKTLPLSNLEALFAASSKNPLFQRQLETYILDRFQATACS